MRVILDTAEFDGSPKIQHVSEKVAYNCSYLTVPTSITVVVENSAGSVLTSSMTEGTTSLAGSVLTTPLIKGVADGVKYRVCIYGTEDSKYLLHYFWIHGRL
jgi:hypothetical protein